MRRWVLLATVLILAVLGSGYGLGRPGHSPPSTPHVQRATAPANGCPARPRRLPRNPVSPAAAAALRAAPDQYRGVDTRDATVVAAGRASRDSARGGQVQHDCGRRVRNRTVVVYLEFPRMRPSASLSQGVMFLSRGRSGWAVWEIAH
jgi:hypothetical protein